MKQPANRDAEIIQTLTAQINELRTTLSDLSSKVVLSKEYRPPADPPTDEAKRPSTGKATSQKKPKGKTTKSKAKPLAKHCLNRKTYKVNSVKLNEFEHRCWQGAKSLINGYELYLSDVGLPIPVLVERPQITAKEVIGAIGEDVMDKSLQWHANAALNRFEQEGLIVLKRVERITGTGSKRKTFKGLRTKVSIGPAGA